MSFTMHRNKKTDVAGTYDDLTSKMIISIRGNIKESIILKSIKKKRALQILRKKVEYFSKIEENKEKKNFVFKYEVLNSLLQEYYEKEGGRKKVIKKVKEFLFILKKMKSDKKKIYKVNETEHLVEKYFNISISNRYIPKDLKQY